MRRAIATGMLVLLGVAAGGGSAPPAAAAEIAGYGMSALAVGVQYALNSPGLLPVGDPAQGTVLEVDVPIARTGVSQGPLMNAIASPAYPGDTVAHLGTAIVNLAPEAPAVPNYPVVAEANYPPTPGKGAIATFGQSGLGEGSARTSATGADVIARTVSQTIEGVVEIEGATARNDIKIAADKVSTIATSVTGRISIADLIVIDGVAGFAEAVSDGVTGTPAARLEIGKVTVAGQPAYIDRDGIHIAGGSLGAGLINGLQDMVNAALNTDGIGLRTVAPGIESDGGLASATSGALVITLQRVVPAIGVPGVPALEIPGGPTVALGTPSVNTNIEILIGAARVVTNATGTPVFDIGNLVPPLPESSVLPDDFTSISGPGASLPGALGEPSQVGDSALGFQPAAEQTTGKAIPFGFVIFGVFGALAASGSLLGYARWQLLEGRHR